MATIPKSRTNLKTSDSVRDVVIGMSDGLTVPFALAAGVSAAIQSTHVVVAAGLAEVAAGSIAMGLGGYLAAKGDAEHYESEVLREHNAIAQKATAEQAEVKAVLFDYGLDETQSDEIVTALARNESKWIEFMLRIEHGIDPPDPRRALRSAATIGGSYIAGGFIPLFPYFLFPKIDDALKVSIVVTLIALTIFGFVKSGFNGTSKITGALQTVFVGGLAAGAAFLLARLVSQA